MTLKALYDSALTVLQQTGQEDARASLRILLEDVLHFSVSDLYIRPESPVPEDLLEKFQACVKRLAGAEPLAYILGSCEFMGLPFQVSPAVLVPRPDTECLVEWILEDWKGKNASFADLGTGSGCIPVSLLHHAPTLLGSACDISPEALEVARGNAQLNQIQNLVFYQGDLLEAFPKESRFDFIVSNPPYITEEAMQSLPANVKREPFIALYGGTDGLDFYRRIVERAKTYLVPGGLLYFEIGYDQGKRVPELLAAAGYSHIQVRKDYAGLDRCVKAQWAPAEKE